eukprot:UN04518
MILIKIKLKNNFGTDPANKDVGEFMYWPMGLAGLYDPRDYNETQRAVMSNTTVWDFDQLPTRMPQLIQLLKKQGPIDPQTNKPRPVIFLLHCQAGIDRTGQAVAGYRIAATPLNKFTPNTLQEYFKLNWITRLPNDWSVKALEWYCLYYKYNYNVNMGDCLKIANCKRFGSCEPIDE